MPRFEKLNLSNSDCRPVGLHVVTYFAFSTIRSHLVSSLQELVSMDQDVYPTNNSPMNGQRKSIKRMVKDLD